MVTVIKNSGYSEKLKEALIDVTKAKRPEEHYYIGFHKEVNNPEFNNELAYATMKYPDCGYRLLALFRYWNIIQYYFPYKNLVERDWKTVLETFIPKVLAVQDATEYVLVMLELIGKVKDTHANIWGRNPVLQKYRGLRFAPFDVTFIEENAVLTSFIDKKFEAETGLVIGDIIVAVNDVPVEHMIQMQLPYRPASNYPTQLRNIARDLLRTNDTAIAINVVHENKTERKIVKTIAADEFDNYIINAPADTSFKMLTKDIAYINHGTLHAKHLPQIWKAMKNTKGVIIDDRNYPSDFVLYEFGKYLMPTAIPFVKFTFGHLSHPSASATTDTSATTTDTTKADSSTTTPRP
ncbi:MAG: hypothetical protein EOO13_14630 [Chitinophagaceae bacterium]|nr:MAG: hypothetical protein EOO13_14630 [Chitinophagaceae bacterium]